MKFTNWQKRIALVLTMVMMWSLTPINVLAQTNIPETAPVATNQATQANPKSVSEASSTTSQAVVSSSFSTVIPTTTVAVGVTMPSATAESSQPPATSQLPTTFQSNTSPAPPTSAVIPITTPTALARLMPGGNGMPSATGVTIGDFTVKQIEPTVWSNQKFTVRVDLKITSASYDLAGSKIKVSVPKEYLDNVSFQNFGGMDGGTLTGATYSIANEGLNRVLTYTFTQLAPSSIYFPVFLQTKNYDTPDQYKLPVTATFITAQGDSFTDTSGLGVVQSVRKINSVKPIVNDIYMNGAPFFGGVKHSAYPDYISEDRAQSLVSCYESEIVDTVNSSLGNRYIEKSRVTFTLPVYTDYKGATRVAIIDDVKTPGWTLSTDGKYATLEKVQVFFGASIFYYDVPRIAFKMPGAKADGTTQYKAKYKITFVPLNPSAYELVNLTTVESADYTFSLKSTIDPIRCRKLGHFIQDTVFCKQRPMSWIIVTENTSASMPIKNLEVIDYIQDSRMEYDTLKLDSNNTGLKDASGNLGRINITAKMSDGSESIVATNVSANDDSVKYSLPKNASSIKISAVAGSVLNPSKTFRATIYTKLRDPVGTKYTGTSLDTFSSSVGVAGLFVGENGFDIPQHLVINVATYKLLPYKPAVSLSNTVNTNVIGTDQVIQFEVVVDDSPQAEFKLQPPDTLQNFAVVNLLPAGMMFSSAYIHNNPTGANYGVFEKDPEIIDNYQDKGRTALIWRTKEPYNASVINSQYKIRFSAKTTSNMTMGKNTNEAFMGWTNDNPSATNPTIQQVGISGATVPDTFGIAGSSGVVAKATADFTFAPAGSFVPSKLVKGHLNQVAVAGHGQSEIGGSAVFTLRESNLNDTNSIDTMQLMDILPRKGIAGSQYDLYLSGAATAPATYAVEYATGTPSATLSWLQDNANWSATIPSDLKTVTAVRFTMQGGNTLPPKTVHDFIVPASVPNDANLTSGMTTLNRMYTYIGGTEMLYSESFLDIYSYRIQGKAFEDRNRDGVMQSDEKALSNVPVQLLNENGTPALDANGKAMTTVTDAAGQYRFAVPKLPANKLKVSFDVDTGRIPTTVPSDALTNNFANHASKNGAKSVTDAFALSFSPGVVVTRNAGFYWDTYDITVTKVVKDANGKVIPEERSFTVNITGPEVRTFTLTNKTPVVLSGLKEGAYTFVETGAIGYDVTYTPATVTVGTATPNGVITITNTESKPTKLTISKQVVGLTPERIATASSFEITLTGPGAPQVFFLKHGENKVLATLPIGEYTVTEKIPNGYKMTTDASNNKVTIDYASTDKTVVVTNTYDGTTDNTDPNNPKIVEANVTATKTWANIPAGTTSFPKASLTLYQNGTIYNQAGLTNPVVLTAIGNGNQTAAWDKLPKFAPDGSTFIYTVKETALSNGYKATVSPDGFTFTNTYDGTTDNTTPTNPTTVESSRTVTKTWANIPAGTTTFPTAELKLFQNGATFGQTGLVNPVRLTATGNGNQTAAWSRLPKFAPDGSDFDYIVKETALTNGYKSSFSTNRLVFTNTYDGTTDNTDPDNPKIVEANVIATKTWANIPVGAVAFPTASLTLCQNGTTYAQAGLTNPVNLISTGNGDQTAKWHKLPKFAPDGTLLAYTVKETELSNGYKATVSADGLTFTNTYDGKTNNDDPNTPIVEEISITSTKRWANIPAGTTVFPKASLTLLLNGTKYTQVGLINPIDLTATGNGDQVAKWDKLPKFASDGNMNRYTVIETALSNGYKAFVNNDGLVTMIINTYDGTTNNDNPDDPKTETVNHVVTKQWTNIPLGTTSFPSAKLTLFQNGAVYVNASVTNPVALTATGNGAQEAKWEQLPKYDAGGNLYNYTVKETAITNGYKATVSADKLTFTNEYNGKTNNDNPDKPVDVSNNIHALKTWANIPIAWINRPRGTASDPEAMISLYQNGILYNTHKVFANGGNGTDHTTWENMPLFAPDGSLFVYTFKETALVNGYKSSVNAEGNHFTNTYDGITNNTDPENPKAEPVDLTVTKRWTGMPADAAKFPSANIAIYQNGELYVEAGKINPIVITSTGNGDQTAKWQNLLKYSPDGKTFAYTAKEVAISNGYKSTVSPDGLTFTNAYDGTTKNTDPTKPVSEEASLAVTKRWAGIPNDTVKFPSASLTLLQNGISFAKSGITNPVILSAVSNGDQNAQWTKLPKFDTDGSIFTYTAKETAITNGYKATVSPDGLLFTNTYDGTTNNTNPDAPKTEESSLTATKRWAGIPDGTTKFPKASLTLLRNGTTLTQAGLTNPIALTATGNGTQEAKWDKLFKFAPDGSVFAYTVKETALSNGYQASKSDDGLTIINTYDGKTNNDNPDTPKLEEANLAATKRWSGIPDGTTKFPKAILSLFQNGTIYSGGGVPNSVELTAAGNGDQVAKWDKLLKFAPDGSAFAYTAKETGIANGYRASVSADGLTFTNAYDGATNNTDPTKPVLEESSVAVTKRWANIPAGATLFPKASITLQQNGTSFVKSGVANPIALVSTGNGDQAVKWNKLAKFAPDGSTFVYTTKETALSNGYKASVSADGSIITNSYDSSTNNENPDTPKNEEAQVSVTKRWVGIPAGTIVLPKASLTLYQNGVMFNKVGGNPINLVAVANGDQTAKWDALPKFNTDGSAFAYTVRETALSNGYKGSTSADGLTITNTYDGTTNNENTDNPTGEETLIIAAKQWENIPAATVKFPKANLTLYQNGMIFVKTGVTNPVVLNATGNGAQEAKWDKLPKFDGSGSLYVYTVKETALSNGYKATVSTDGLTFTNAYDGTTDNTDPTNPKTEEINLVTTKRWAGIPDGTVKFPKATLALYQNGTAYVKSGVTNPVNFVATGNGDQTAAWSNLPKFAPDGSNFVYLAKETTLSNGYASSVSPDGLTVTNTYDGTTNNDNPDNPKMEVAQHATSKLWVNIPDGTVKFPKASIMLYQNGATFAKTGITNPMVLNSVGNGIQEAKWSNLPKFAPDGSNFAYSAKETALSNGYKASASNDGLIIANSYDGTTNNENPEAPKTEESSLTATKHWAGIPDGTVKFPKASITLQQNGTAYAKLGVVNPIVLTSTGNGDQVVKWDKLLKFAPDGSVFAYTAKETAIANGYKATVSADGLTFTNTYDGTTNNENPDTPKTEEASLAIIKRWINIPSGTTQFPSASLTLLQNGAVYSKAGLTSVVDLTATGNVDQEVRWEKLFKFAPDGSAFVYTAKETKLSNGYKGTVSGDGLTFTNAYDGITNNENPDAPKTEETIIAATKRWANIPDGTTKFPSASLTLFQNGVVHNKAGLTNPVMLVATGNNNQAAQWDKLLKFAPDGSAFAYTVKETALSNGYKAAVSLDGLVFTNTYDGTTNNENPDALKAEEANLAVTKRWGGIPDGTTKFPKASLTLYQNNAACAQVGVTNPVVLTATGNGDQVAKWEKLFKFAPDGSIIGYTAKETALSNGYKAAISADGLIFTNTYDGKTDNTDPTNPKVVEASLNAIKRWVGIPADVKIQPKASITLRQNGTTYVNGGLINPIDLTAAGNGDQTAAWSKLPKFAPDGSDFAYTAKETALSNGYKGTVSADGLTFTNTYDGKTDNTDPTNPNAGETLLAVTKTWANIPAGTKTFPATTLTLYQNGAQYAQTGLTNPVKLTATGNGDQTFKWEKLPKFDGGGKLYAYTIKETALSNGYKATVSADGLTFTNTYDGKTDNTDPTNPKTKEVTLAATKTWANIPAGTTTFPVANLTLHQNGKAHAQAGVINPVVLTATGNGNQVATWNKLPKYSPDGSNFAYTVKETALSNGYKATVSADGLIFTNTYDGKTDNTDPINPKTKEVNLIATKVWENIPTGTTSLPKAELKLFQNGTTFGQTGVVNPVLLTATGNGNQAAQWSKLPKFAPDGSNFVYNVIEDALSNGYKATASVMSTDGITFTNTYDGTTDNTDPTNPKTEEVTLAATKTWANIPTGTTTFPVANLTLHQNGEARVQAGLINPVVLTATGNGNQTATWSKLPKYAPDGSAFAYTVKETALSNGYKASVSPDGLTFTNMYDGTTNNTDPNNPKTEVTTLTATKRWAGIPTAISKLSTATLSLFQNGVSYVKTGVTVPINLTATGNGDQTAKWDNLPKYAPDGNIFAYTVKETSSNDGYKMTVSADGLTITNTFIELDSPSSPFPRTGEPADNALASLGLLLATAVTWLLRRKKCLATPK